MQKMCETMTRLICQASRLRADEPGLKSTSVGARMCLNCNLGIVENLYHMIMQCPIMEDIRYNMYTEHEGQSSGDLAPGEIHGWRGNQYYLHWPRNCR